MLTGALGYEAVYIYNFQTVPNEEVDENRETATLKISPQFSSSHFSII